MDATEIAEILRKHTTWTRGEDGGERADLHCADLQGASLRAANLYCAQLRGADLRYADLTFADLRGANIRDANLFGAYLCGANLHDANLCGASVSAANLRGADLRGANLYGADLSGAVGILSLGPIGSREDTLYVVQHADGLRYKTGCFWGTRGEFLAAVEQSHASDSHGVAYRLAVQLAEVVLGGVP